MILDEKLIHIKIKRKISVLLIIFIIGIITQIVALIHFSITEDKISLFYSFIDVIIIFLMELYVILLLLYLILKKYTKVLYLPSLLNSIGLIIFLTGLIFESTSLSSIDLLFPSVIIFLILKLVSLGLAIRLIIYLRKT